MPVPPYGLGWILDDVNTLERYKVPTTFRTMTTFNHLYLEHRWFEFGYNKFAE
jgi:hypothetical protein